MTGLVSTWMGDRFEIPGAVDFALFSLKFQKSDFFPNFLIFLFLLQIEQKWVSSHFETKMFFWNCWPQNTFSGLRLTWMVCHTRLMMHAYSNMIGKALRDGPALVKGESERGAEYYTYGTPQETPQICNFVTFFLDVAESSNTAQNDRETLNFSLIHIRMLSSEFPQGYRNTRIARGKTSQVYIDLLWISWHTCIVCYRGRRKLKCSSKWSGDTHLSTHVH